MHICIFEDEKYKNFEPLIYSRPVYDLVYGASSIKEKIKKEFPDAVISLHCRKYLEPIVKSNNPHCKVNDFEAEQLFFINSRVIEFDKLHSFFANDEDKLLIADDILIAAKIFGKKLDKIKTKINNTIDVNLFDDIPSENTDIKVINYLWDLIYLNGDELRKDFAWLERQNSSVRIKNPENVFSSAHFINSGQVFVSRGVQIKPGVVIDASSGPVYIDENAVIKSNAVIEGPVYIGKSTNVNKFASISENVSIGNVCKVGGEVEDAVIHSYTNKQHPGFLGHSYLGSWINIGADTNCSDLQNNYGTVKVQVNGKHIDSGKQFVGLIMGDHSKTAISTMFNTGTVVGFSCNVFGAGFPPKYIASFGWGGADSVKTYKLTKAAETASKVFERRNKNFNSVDRELFENIFNLTLEDREKRGY